MTRIYSQTTFLNYYKYDYNFSYCHIQSNEIAKKKQRGFDFSEPRC